MLKDEGKKESKFTSTVAIAFAAGLSAVAMSVLGLFERPENVGYFIIQALLFGCIFTAIKFSMFRFFRWLYS